MKKADQLLQHSEYLKVLRPLLPQEAFARNPRKLLFVGAHLGIVTVGYTLMRLADAWYILPLLVLVIGHSIACLGFYAHDLSHKTVLRDGPLLRIVETNPLRPQAFGGVGAEGLKKQITSSNPRPDRADARGSLLSG